MTRSTFRKNHAVGALTVFGLGTAALGPLCNAQIRFDPPREYPGNFREVAVADLNGNGHLDAAAATPDGVHVFFNTGDGTLVHEVTLFEGLDVITVQAGDVDGDGHVDLAILEQGTRGARRLHFFYNDGDGRRGEVHSRDMPDYMWRGLALADMSGNGRADVVYVGSFRTVWLLEHRARGEYRQRQLYQWTHQHADVTRISSPVIGDLDGDGDLDVAFLYTYTHGGGVNHTEILILFNEGPGQQPRAQAISPGVPGLPSGLALGDLDGDGDLDIGIVAFDYTGGYYKGRYGYEPTHFGILVNDGQGRFMRGPVLEFGEGRWGSSLLLADLDSDGRLDAGFVSTVNFAPTLLVLRNLGDLAFEEPIEIPLWPIPSDLAFGDLAGDGQPDMLVTTWDGPMYQLLNATPIDNPRLFVRNLVRGEPARFLVMRAEPGEQVHFLYSLTGQGNTVGIPLLGGITLDLLDPIVHFGSATADANGRALLTRLVPSNAPLRPVTFQSVIRRGPGGVDSVKTPFQVGVIEE